MLSFWQHASWGNIQSPDESLQTPVLLKPFYRKAFMAMFHSEMVRETILTGFWASGGAISNGPSHEESVWRGINLVTKEERKKEERIAGIACPVALV